MKYALRKQLGFRLMEDEPGQGGGGQDSAPANNITPEMVADLQSQIETMTGVIKKTREERDGYAKEAKAAKQYREAVGDLSPERLKEIQQAQKQTEEFEQRLAAAASEAASKAEQLKDEHYSQQIKELSAATEEYKTKYYQEIQDKALREIFFDREIQGKPSEYANFKKMVSEYFPYDHESNQFGQIVNSNGEPYFVKGKPGTAKDLMQEMRAGKFGDAVSYCFSPLNGSSGAGLPRTGANGAPLHGMEAMSKSERLSAGFRQSSGR